MLHKCILLAIIMVLSQEVSAQNPGGSGWVFKSEKDNIKVYYRKTADVYELKLTTSVQTTLHGLIKLFSESNQYNKWAYKVAETRLLKKNSETDFYYYARIDFPWPMSDRDVVMHSTLYQNKDLSVVCTSNCVSDFLPEVEGLVRMPKSTTRWALFPGKDDWLYIEYYLYSDPGGNIPDWAVNMALEVGPMETIKNIRNIVSDPRYQTARLAYLK
ncbi:MAG: START domain-containing protein [Saprospiraceae bacterium]